MAATGPSKAKPAIIGKSSGSTLLPNTIAAMQHAEDRIDQRHEERVRRHGAEIFDALAQRVREIGRADMPDMRKIEIRSVSGIVENFAMVAPP